MRTLALLCALCISGSALAAKTKLFTPPNVNEVRDLAIQLARKAGNLDWKATEKAKVKLAGYLPDKSALYMVKIPQQEAVFVRTWQRWDAKWKYNQNKGSVLTAAQRKSLGIITVDEAKKIATQNGGMFGKVSGKLTVLGATRKGFGYSFTITPDSPVQVKVPYSKTSYWNVTQLRRDVNAFGKGETAAPAGDSKYVYVKNPTKTRPAPNANPQ